MALQAKLLSLQGQAVRVLGRPFPLKQDPRAAICLLSAAALSFGLDTVAVILGGAFNSPRDIRSLCEAEKFLWSRVLLEAEAVTCHYVRA